MVIYNQSFHEAIRVGVEDDGGGLIATYGHVTVDSWGD